MKLIILIGGFAAAVHGSARLTSDISIFNQNISVVNLKKLIFLKKASGRPKDFESIAELEFILS